MDICKRQVGRPSRKEAARIDDVVLQGARAAFCRHGVDGASMDEIAQATGVTKQAIYRRYPSKSALLEAVVARDLGRMRAEVPDAGAEPMIALESAARHMFDYGIAPENVGFFAFLAAEAAFCEELRGRFRAWCGEAMAPLLALIGAAQASGALRPGDPRTAAYLLFDLLDGASNRLQLGLDEPFAGRCADGHFTERWSVFRQTWDARVAVQS